VRGIVIVARSELAGDRSLRNPADVVVQIQFEHIDDWRGDPAGAGLVPGKLLAVEHQHVDAGLF
jgi:hypothetical protein